MPDQEWSMTCVEPGCPFEGMLFTIPSDNPPSPHAAWDIIRGPITHEHIIFTRNVPNHTLTVVHLDGGASL